MSGRIHLDFKMAKEEHANRVLKTLVQDALTFLMENIEQKKIRSILLTGSLANGEGTVIEHASSTITSDFDFVVYLDFYYFLRNKELFRKLSHQITATFVSRGIETHVDFLPSNLGFQYAFKFFNLKIYEYEFAIASKCVFGNFPHFDKEIRPTKNDALELAFTVASELVFSELKHYSELEKSYIYAKRALTLLNSLLIFEGTCIETYEKRTKRVKDHVPNEMVSLSETDILMLERFTEYKLHGSLTHLMTSLECTNLMELIGVEKNFLEQLTKKVIIYELRSITKDLNSNNPESPIFYDDVEFAEFSQLLYLYCKHSRLSMKSQLAGILMCTTSILKKDSDRTELFGNFVFRKQSPKNVLNCIITVNLFYGQNPASNILRTEFPWLNLNGNILKRLFSLWRLAEQSVKLY